MICNIINFMETIFDAKDLRRSGYYKWYAPEDLYKEILAKLKIDFDDVSENVEKLENNETYYGIYVGIAEDQPVIRRIGNHLYNSFKSSTLRKSIAAVYGTVNHNEINKFIDNLKVQFFFIDNSYNLHDKERELLQNHFFVLNIQGNSTWADKIALLKERRKNLFS